MSNKSWEDQPDAVVGAEVVLKVTHPSEPRWVEVRHRDGSYYVTNGNLFGSQTLVTKNPLLVFSVVQMTLEHRSGRKPMTVPEGVEVIS